MTEAAAVDDDDRVGAGRTRACTDDGDRRHSRERQPVGHPICSPNAPPRVVVPETRHAAVSLLAVGRFAYIPR